MELTPALAFNILKGMLIEQILKEVPSDPALIPVFRAKVQAFNELSTLVDRTLAGMPKLPPLS